MRHLRYLSILAWPEGWERRALAEHIAEHAGLDVHTLTLRLGVAPPTIIGPVDPSMADAAIQAIIAVGGDAFAPTLGDVEALGPSHLVKDLEIADGRIVIELWRGPGEIIDCADVEILVRAKVGRREQTKPIANTPPPLTMGTTMYLGGGAYGLALGFAAAYAANQAADSGPKSKNIDRSDKLDIHTRDRRVFQIDGDKFGYRMLGNLRGHSDNENIDAMCELLSHVAPDEIVDPYFALWRPPGGIDAIRLPMMQVNHETPAFAFYSRWAALMYRHILGTSA